ncbi:MAG: hypothetical protein ACREFY_19125, partial [Acetobacteraceae bacterium]
MNAYRVWPDEDYADDGDWYAPAPAWRPEPPQWPREVMQQFAHARALWDALAGKVAEVIANPAYDFLLDPQGWYPRLWRVGWPAVTLVHQVYAMTRTAMIVSGERIAFDPYEVGHLEHNFTKMVHGWNFALS